MLNAPVNHAGSIAPYASLMQTMGDRIKLLRSSQSLSLEALGAIIGVSAAALSQWETGQTKGIRPENFLRFCAHFGADPYWVCFGDDGDPRNASGRYRKLVPARAPGIPPK